MSISYQGIGEWCATFACTDLDEGKVVKMSGSATVAECAAGDNFCGVVLAAGRDGEACSVQLGGLATLRYTGSAPSVGFVSLVADAAGGVAVAGESQSGQTYLAVAVDTDAKTVTIKL